MTNPFVKRDLSLHKVENAVYKSDAPPIVKQSYSNMLTASMYRLPNLIVLVAVHLAGCTPNIEPLPPTGPQVRVEAYSNVATSTVIGDIYPEISYGHLTVSLDLAMIAEYRQALLCLAQHWTQLLKHGNLTRDQFNRFSFMDRYARETTSNVVGRLDNVLTSLKVNLSTTLPSDHVHPVNKRPKRQIIAAAIGIAAGLGIGYGASSVASSFSTSNLADIVDKKSNVIATTVAQDALTTATNHESIIRLNKTSTVILKQIGLMNLQWKATQVDLLLLGSALALMETIQKFDDMVTSLDMARRGGFDLHISSHQGLSRSLDLLSQQAAKHGKSIGIALPIDLTRLPATLFHDMITHKLHIISHVPLKGERLTLYAILTPPLQLDPTKEIFASIDLRHEYLALTSDKTLYQVYSEDDLQRCTKVRNRDFFCPQTQLRKSNYQSCSLSLFNNDLNGVRTHCSFQLHSRYAEAERLNLTTFMVTELESSELTINCHGQIVFRDSISGTKLVTIPPGCSGNTANLVFRREAFEADVTITSSFGTLPLLPDNVFPHELDHQWMKTAQAWLSATGKPVDPHTITTISRMEATLAKLDQQKASFSWITAIFHLVQVVLSTLVVAGLVVLGRKLYYCWKPEATPPYVPQPSAPPVQPPFNQAMEMETLHHEELQRQNLELEALRDELRREKERRYRSRRNRSSQETNPDNAPILHHESRC